MSINFKIALEKSKRPESFCPQAGCLWRTARLLNSATGERTPGGRCPRHGGASCPECGKTKYMPGKVNPTRVRGGWRKCTNEFHGEQVAQNGNAEPQIGPRAEATP